jgi:transmembrane protein 17
MSSPFPHSSSNNHADNQNQPISKLQTSEITASLGFAVLLYANIPFSIIYALANGAMVLEKTWAFRFSSTLQRVVLIPAFLIWAGNELTRFWFAYEGNLKERVPQMSAFLLITSFPQIPVAIYLSFFQEFLFPFDKSAGVLMIVVLVLEMIMGYRALLSLIRRQTAQFYRLCQEEEDKVVSRITS